MEAELPQVLVVDDTEENIDILVNTLAPEYDIKVATDGRVAMQVASETQADLILLDIMMPEMDGYEVCERLKSMPSYAEVPVIFLTAMAETNNKTRGFELGAVDYITKPFDALEVQARVRTHIELARARHALAHQNEELEKRVRERTRELWQTQDATIQALASLAETRDNETGQHIHRTQEYVRVLAEGLRQTERYADQLDSQTVEMLYKSAALHDIGKVGVPDSVLLKAGKLTEEEFEIMKGHPTLGRDALLRAELSLGSNSFLACAREIAYTHHEKWDGTGYPRGLVADEIPLSGQLMAIADVYDALTTKRVYKPAFPHSKAVQIVLDGAGTHFSPDLVATFGSLSETFHQIALRLADRNAEVAVARS